MKNQRFKLWFDGACWPNPGGQAAYGWAISDDGEFHEEGCGVIGSGSMMSNNVAEYQGLYHGLKFMKEKGYLNADIHCYGDSKLVCEQMSGRWRVKGGLYVDSFKLAYCMSKEFKMLTISWIPREQNNLADWLSKKALGITRESYLDNQFKRTVGVI